MSAHEKDLNRWQDWNKDPTPQNLSSLIRQMNPVIHKAIQANKGALSPAVVEAEAKIQAVKAFKTYDPDRGTKLSTHITNYLKKVNRLNYKYQEIFNVPENRRIKYSTFWNVHGELFDQLGREPTAEELSEELGWSRAEVARFLAENKRELSDSLPHSSDFGVNNTADSAMTSYVYNDLNPTQKAVFEYRTGYNNKPVLTNPEIRKKLGLSQGQLSYSINTIKSKVLGARGTMG